ncbi:hypothetical protein TNIN_255241 [Trichonephila inaurata madagascariensis]|uniref:Uncharacterized protein n=1 Tax=Trichonephila inaurata madagascariensis TaxID=2747483 RepID=A0A8X6YMV4_9ARAC|nr:hypothetical protein TNIN_255241 [Trichonephila inaurata madagascariensis]
MLEYQNSVGMLEAFKNVGVKNWEEISRDVGAEKVGIPDKSRNVGAKKVGIPEISRNVEAKKVGIPAISRNVGTIWECWNARVSKNVPKLSLLLYNSQHLSEPQNHSCILEPFKNIYNFLYFTENVTTLT